MDRRLDREALQQSFEAFAKSRLGQGGFQGIWNPFIGEELGRGTGGSNAPSTGGELPPAGKKKPKDPKDPNADKQQWTFQPNALDASPYLPVAQGGTGAAPVGPASQYTVRLQSQPWMLNPAGQLVPQNYDYFNQWASGY